MNAGIRAASVRQCLIHTTNGSVSPLLRKSWASSQTEKSLLCLGPIQLYLDRDGRDIGISDSCGVRNPVTILTPSYRKHYHQHYHSLEFVSARLRLPANRNRGKKESWTCIWPQFQIAYSRVSAHRNHGFDLASAFLSTH